MLKIFSLLFSLLFYTFCSAQNSVPYNFSFKSYTTLQGLSDNTVVKTVKDKHGFLWVATHNGIARFDGLNFKVYTHNPQDSTSLRSIWVCDLLVDDRQTLWASTEWGLCYYDEIKDQFIYINKRTELQLVFKMPLCKDSLKRIWIAAEDGLKKINPVTKKFSNTSLKRIADPQFITPINNEELLIGTRGRGLFKYNITRDSYKDIYLEKFAKDVHYMDAMQDEDGTWIACSEGLLQLKNNSYILHRNGSNNLTGEKIDQLMCVKKFSAAFGATKIICGTYNKKLVLFDKKTNTFTYQWLATKTTPEGFEPSIVYNFNEDKNMLWIGTDRGLFQINLENQQQQSYFLDDLLNGENNALVKKVIADKPNACDNVWLIPWQPFYGIILYNLSQKKIINEWSTLKNKNYKKYTDILRSSKFGYIVACRDSALDFYSAEKGFIKTLKLNAQLLCMEEDATGNLWVGHNEGLILVNAPTGLIENYRYTFDGTDIEKNSFGGSFPIISIKQSAKKLWLAAAKYGLFCFDIATKKFTPYRQKYSGSFSTLNRCSSITLKGDDSVWVGTMAGLSCFIPSQQKFINYDVNNGLKSTYVYTVGQDDKNNIWARGNADIFCFNTVTKKIIGSKLNQQYDVSCYQQKITVDNNKVFLGHEGGFTIFNTLDFTKAISEPPVAIISNCKINNADIYFNRDSNRKLPVQLKYFENQVTFDLNAVEYNFPEDIEYSYRLFGMDKAWTDAGNKRSISYSHLSPGSYRFGFYVTNKRNKNKSELAFCEFTIEPAWWQYWWFWPLLALIFALAVLIIARKRIKHIRKKEKDKTAVNKTMAELETKMLRSQMNPHFIFNSLNSIQKYIWENKEEDAAEYLARFAKLMRAILENSRKETVTLKEEIDVMKLYVDLEHRRSNGGFDYTLKADANLFEKNAVIPPLIMQPFIENAIWHGLNTKGSKGNLSIHVFEKNNKLVCVIDDDGVGRHQKKEVLLTENKSLGINITQQRIEKLIETTGQQATVFINDKVENGRAAGTKVTITLPMQTL